MATLGWLKIGLTTDTSQFSKGLKRASSQVADFKGMLVNAAAGVGLAFGVKEVVSFVKGTMDASDATHDMARRLGIATEDLAKLNHVAQVAGVDQETLASSLEKMNARLGEVAVEGSGPAADALKRFGISARAMATLDPAVAFRQLAGVLGQIPNPAERAKVAMDLFGKGGQAMIQIAAEGKAGIAALEAEAGALGLAINAVDSEKIGEANDGLDRMWGVIQGVGNTLATTLAPYITYAADSFVSWAKDGSKGASFVSQALDWVVTAMGAVADAIQVGQTGWHYFQAAFAETISFMLAGIDQAIRAFGWLFEKITGTKLEVTNLAKELSDAFEAAAVGEMQKAETVWNQKAGHQQVREFVDTLNFEASKRAELAAGKESAFRRGGAVEGTKLHELKFAGATEMGSKDAYSAILKSRSMLMGAGKGGVEQSAKATADATQRTAIATSRMVQLLEGKAGGDLGREMQGAA